MAEQLTVNRWFWLRMFEQGLLFAGGAALVCAPNGWLRFLGMCLIGIVYARNLEFVHECLHGTAIHNKRLGRIIGKTLALPMLVSFAQWRIEHAQHHLDVRREGFRYEYERLTSIGELFLHILMIRHFARACSHMFFLRQESTREIVYDHLMMLAVLSAVTLASCVFHFPFLIWLWLLPLIVAAIVHTHIELPEHFGREHTNADAFRNSRIISANRFVTWLVNANNYHALHHFDARIPIDRLPGYYAAHRLPHRDINGKRETYTAFYWNFYRELIAKI